MDRIKNLGRKYNLFPLVSQGDYNPPAIIKADGIYLYDTEGKEYIDLSSQYVNVNLGHGNRKIIEAVQNQLEELSYAGSKYAVKPAVELAEKLITVAAPEMDGKVFFTLGGADANENAVKIAKNYTGRYKILSSYRSYHGSTYGAGNLTGEARRFSVEPGIPGFIKFFYPDYSRDGIYFDNEKSYSSYCISKLEEQIIYENPDNIAALFLETVIGSNGVLIPPEGYMEAVREICTKNGILLVLDEVMTGFFRTGSWFSYQNYNIVPDIITFAKGVSCGYIPLGGVIVSSEISHFYDSHPFPCTLTYGAHPAGCAAGIAAMDEYIKMNTAEQVKKISPLFSGKLEKLKSRFISAGEVRSIGLLGIIELVKDNNKTSISADQKHSGRIMADIMGIFYDNSLATYHTQNMISVAPPLTITEKELDEMFSRLENVLSEIDKKYCI